MTLYDNQKYHTETLSSQIRELLDKDHILTAKNLCKLLNLPYLPNRDYINHIRSKWKSDYKIGLGGKCLRFHNVRASATVPVGVVRGQAIVSGWRVTRARNRMLVWSDHLGRLEWFETGRVNVFIRKPASEGKAVQLLANGFTKCGLILDIKVWETVRRSLQFVGEHATLDLGVPLPYSRIELIKDSNGVVVKTGDLSHPTSIEIEFCYPRWAERNENLLNSLLGSLREGLNGNGVAKPIGEDYSS